MLDELVNVIETLQTRIRDHGNTLRQNETRTRAALIDPLLQALGWDVADPGVVTPEYDVSGQRVDYALLGPSGKPAATVEAKKLGEPLAAHRMQMLNYSNAANITYAGLTDGNQWELYEVFKQATLEERRLLDLRVLDTPAHECALKLLLLWRPNLASGQPVAASEPVLASALTETLTQTETAVNPLPPVPPSSDGWTSLREIQPGNNQPWRPSAIRLPDGSEKQISRWWHVPKEVSEYLVRTGKLTHGKCPVKYGKRADIVHSQPQPSKAGTLGHLHQLSNGLYIRKLTSGGGLIRNAKFLLKLFGEDEGEVWLKPG